MSSSETKAGPLRRLGAGLSAIFTFIYRVFFVLSLLIGAGIAYLILSGGPTPSVEDNVGLVVAPTGALVERTEVEPLQEALRQLSREPARQTAVGDIVTALERAKDDDRIAFVVLKVDELAAAGHGTVDQVARAVQDFRESGKPVYVWAESLTQTQYLLAAQADDIALDPMGGLWLEGYAVYPAFFAGLLDRLGIEAEVFRVGDYKSAVEPFLREDMSEAARENTQAWLDSLWATYLERSSAVREGTGEAISAYLENLPDALEAAGGSFARLQHESGLVDRLETLQEFRDRLGETVGMDEDGHGSFRQIHHRRYLQATRGKDRDRKDKAVIAQITVQGVIVDGVGDIGTAGGEVIARQLDQARRDDKVAAVVLRVDSPGGSVLASERVRRAVRALRDDSKPVVASLASQAASGGYWVAMDADEILAHPGTITGSIGVFGLWFNLAEGLSRLGISSDGVATTPLAGKMRFDRPLDPDVRRIFQANVEYAYRQFVDSVAEARGMSEADVESLAGGRVFSGVQAAEGGLVDALGDLQAAAERAAELAGLEPGQYRLMMPRTEMPGLFGTLRRLTGQVLAVLEGHALGRWLASSAMADVDRELAAKALVRSWWSDPHGRYALCDCTLRDGQAPAALALPPWREIR